MKLRLRCSTINRDFQADVEPDANGIAWGKCPFCDTHRRTKDDPGYDPKAPQPHPYPEIIQRKGKKK